MHPSSLMIIVSILFMLLNPLGPQDALKHHLTFLKTGLIFLRLEVLKRKFP